MFIIYYFYIYILNTFIFHCINYLCARSSLVATSFSAVHLRHVTRYTPGTHTSKHERAAPSPERECTPSVLRNVACLRVSAETREFRRLCEAACADPRRRAKRRT